MICGNVISNSVPSEAVEGCLLKIEGRGAISLSLPHLYTFSVLVQSLWLHTPPPGLTEAWCDR